MCGGTEDGQTERQRGDGLSPRVRGNPARLRLRYLRVRSIPACAGEPSDRQGALHSGRVYPRVCGGTRRVAPRRPVPFGLSPRVRGNLVKYFLKAIWARSIPACAGEPRSRRQPTHSARVYPRVCGGTQPDAVRAIDDEGLSPRVRGNHPCGRQYDSGRRSIPACAGEPVQRLPSNGTAGVYPRVCGGTGPTASVQWYGWGLSPRVRGNRPLADKEVLSMRSIPACAGEPLIPKASVIERSVYPRVCGGTYAA